MRQLVKVFAVADEQRCQRALVLLLWGAEHKQITRIIGRRLPLCWWRSMRRSLDASSSLGTGELGLWATTATTAAADAAVAPAATASAAASATTITAACCHSVLV